MKLATIAYIPPRRFPEADAFNQNIRAYRTRQQLVLFSDDSHWQCGWACDDPEKARTRKWYTISNCIFLSALSIARTMGIEWFLYLESDSRVRGHYWDERIFDEHFGLGPEVRMSGTMVLWNIHAAGQKNMERALDYAQMVRSKTGRAPCIFSNVQPHEQVGIGLYPNGSCAVYHLPTLERIFGQVSRHNMLQSAILMTAWDLEIGFNAWRLFGEKIFDSIAPLNSVYSGCTDVFSSLEERKQMLMSGEKAAVHQTKTTDPML